MRNRNQRAGAKQEQRCYARRRYQTNESRASTGTNGRALYGRRTTILLEAAQNLYVIELHRQMKFQFSFVHTSGPYSHHVVPYINSAETKHNILGLSFVFIVIETDSIRGNSILIYKNEQCPPARFTFVYICIPHRI